jgi:hypothetical protein
MGAPMTDEYLELSTRAHMAENRVVAQAFEIANLKSELGKRDGTIRDLWRALDWATNVVEAVLDYHAQGDVTTGVANNKHHFRECLDAARNVLVAVKL